MKNLILTVAFSLTASSILADGYNMPEAIVSYARKLVMA